MIFKFRKIEIGRTFLVGVPVHPADPIRPDLWYLNNIWQADVFVCWYEERKTDPTREKLKSGQGHKTGHFSSLVVFSL